MMTLIKISLRLP